MMLMTMSVDEPKRGIMSLRVMENEEGWVGVMPDGGER
jgi:hypothetical protein